jgi:N-acetyltransferase 10
MEAHARYRTEAHNDVVGRFNERFILSLASCASCLVLDDELNVLPISRHAKSIAPILVGDAPKDKRGKGAEDSDGEDDKVLGVVPVMTESQKELQNLKNSLAETEMVGGLVNQTRTLDQAKALLTFAEAISEKTLRSTVALTAGRGRGKSAALGLAIAAAVGYGYSNIFVTSPSPENLTTLFEFVLKGLDALAFKEHLDYEAIASTNPEFNKAVVRVNVFKGHRQTVQYILPQDAEKLAQAELLVIDEAAAIPLPLVKKLLGPYLVFLASTVNGYEGTGRSLSLKLIQQLRSQQIASQAMAANIVSASQAAAALSADPWAASSSANKAGSGSSTARGAMPGAGGGGSSSGGRTFREVSLNEPIRYAAGDGVEQWLNDLLCLDATNAHRLAGRLPAPSECELYAVDRDALFSYHKVSEGFLHRMMSLYVSSHYKNTPNDLQLMSDAPAQKLFVLLGPQSEGSDGLPDVLCVIQVALEGQITRDAVKASLARGQRAAGDLIPWTLSQQFQDDNFAALSGARVVRIATHSDATKMGYGSRALELLLRYFEGAMIPLDEGKDAEDAPVGGVDRGRKYDEEDEETAAEKASSNKLAIEKVKPRKQLPPLLVNVGDIRRPERLHWLGVSYGLTLNLFNFWRRGGYLPVYLRQTANDLTAEHTAIMLRPLDTSDMRPEDAPRIGWHVGFVADFARRFAQLLSFEFKSFDVTLALSVMDAGCSVLGPRASGAGEKEEDGTGNATLAASALIDSAQTAQELGGRASVTPLTPAELGLLFTPYDLKRLEAYSRSLVDYHMIIDLLPDLGRLYFQNRLPVCLPKLQAGILLGLGLQKVSVDTLAAQFEVAVNQVLALFNKTIRKLASALQAIHEKGVSDKVLGGVTSSTLLSSTLLSGGKKGVPTPSKIAQQAPVQPVLSKNAQQALMSDPELRKYAVPNDAAFDAALKGKNGSAPVVISVKKESSHHHSGEKDKQAGDKRARPVDPDVYDPAGRLQNAKIKKAKSAR